MKTLIRKKAAGRLTPGGDATSGAGRKVEAQCCAKISPAKAGCHD